MTDLRASIESTMFKQVPGGSVFRAPNPWLYGGAAHYLVDETQKARIIAILTPRHPTLTTSLASVAVMLWAALVGVAAVWLFGSGHANPTVRGVVAMTAIVVLVPLLVVHLFIRRSLRRLQPVLDHLPRSNERITYREQRRGLANAMSMKRTLWLAVVLALACIVQIVTLIIRTDRFPLFSDLTSSIGVMLAILFGVQAAVFFVRAWRKSKQT